jgi:phosphoribosylglycinamide formyltransferase-1
VFVLIPSYICVDQADAKFTLNDRLFLVNVHEWSVCVETLRIAFFASHGGSSAYHIMQACHDQRLAAEPCLLISNNSKSLAIERAAQMGVPTYHFSAQTHPDPHELDQAILAVLKAHQVNLIILSGYMKKLGPATLVAFAGRVLNVHPALLPNYGGQGMYGNAVHEAVLAAGDKVTGVTIHVVDKEYDHGPIVAQCEVPVLPGDTVEMLRERVLQQEFVLYLDTLQKIVQGEIRLTSTTG